MDDTLMKIAQAAKRAARRLAGTPTDVRDGALRGMAAALVQNRDAILQANLQDIENAKKNNLKPSFIERLTLTPDRIESMCEGLYLTAALADPIGEYDRMWTRPNGLKIAQKRVPLGVVGIIFESRPNVFIDAAALCLKSGNACILRGGSDAIHSNIALRETIAPALEAAGIDPNAVALVEDTSRETVNAMMRLNGLIDVLIPRGGAGLIESVVKNATVPVIQTGVGVCHTYVDSKCFDFEMAYDIVINAKVQRPSVCNSMETLLVDAAVADAFLPECLKRLAANGVEIRGCSRTQRYATESIAVLPASEEDYYAEFNDLILAVKVVNSMEEAIEHIHEYGSAHSEAIVTQDYARAQRFLDEVDAAAVYVNASTRFTDGFEFGFGAEIGISNQKLHARGPMGLVELTTIKYVIYGNGQIRS
jgi:glutamate-5-semialdehyde dehydrogenase